MRKSFIKQKANKRHIKWLLPFFNLNRFWRREKTEHTLFRMPSVLYSVNIQTHARPLTLAKRLNDQYKL